MVPAGTAAVTLYITATVLTKENTIITGPSKRDPTKTRFHAHFSPPICL